MPSLVRRVLLAFYLAIDLSVPNHPTPILSQCVQSISPNSVATYLSKKSPLPTRPQKASSSKFKPLDCVAVIGMRGWGMTVMYYCRMFLDMSLQALYPQLVRVYQNSRLAIALLCHLLTDAVAANTVPAVMRRYVLPKHNPDLRNGVLLHNMYR
jgi:hypothetical protein